MLEPVRSHPWDLTPREAMALQTELAAAVSVGDDRERPWSSVAGIDVGLRSGVARAAVVVCSLDDLHIIEQVIVERPVTFPYVPGLLSFREAPVILAALAQLGARPDVLLFDAQGLAHPRRLGLASHVGVLLNWPSIGCAKSRLCGVAQEPPTARGGRCPLIDQGEVVGSVVRTRMGVRPVYVSAGHRVSLETAVDLVLHCGSGYRLPEPTRWAHRYASSA